MRNVPDNTGERILLEKETPLMIARHFCAYRFAGDYARNKSVLDVGCGEGYGSYYLAGLAREVTAIDRDEAIIEYAKSKYKRDNLNFQVMDVKDLGAITDKFECITSFQFIEHLGQPQEFLNRVRNLLKEDGIFICSTPNRKDASPGSANPFNRFHIKEYFIDEYRELLGNAFTNIEILGLKRGGRLNFYRRVKKIGVCRFLPDCVNPVKRFYDNISCNDFIFTKDNLDTALDFIAVCKS
jgi:SAM-dependent methyltransferase